MTKTRFIESISNQGWNKINSEGETELWEREGSFIFLKDEYVSDSNYQGSWSVSYSDIKTTRSRRHYYEIEKVNGDTVVVLSEEDDIEIGCMG